MSHISHVSHANVHEQFLTVQMNENFNEINLLFNLTYSD